MTDPHARWQNHPWGKKTTLIHTLLRRQKLNLITRQPPGVVDDDERKTAEDVAWEEEGGENDISRGSFGGEIRAALASGDRRI